MEKLVGNISGKSRRAILRGRPHIVAPTTLIVPGVLNGSQGPILYTAEENRRNPEAWNHMPLVVYHSTDQNGNPVSARTPEELNKRSVGVLLNVHTEDDGRLVGESWFDEADTLRVDPRITNALNDGRSIEISTGLAVTVAPAPENAAHNGVAYNAVAGNYRPDHLAILPDQIGACSLSDGCGVNNQASFNDRRERLQGLIKEKYSAEDSLWVEDVFDNYFVYQRNGILYRLGYTETAGATQLSGDESIKVVKETKYISTNNETNNTGDNTMKADRKKQIIDGLISNCADCGWKESDRETLNSLTDNTLETLDRQRTQLTANVAVVNAVRKVAGEKVENLGEFVTANLKTPETKKIDNQTPTDEKKVLTENEWLAGAPESVREDLHFARQEKQRQKDQIINQLLTNVAVEHRPAHAQRLQNRSLEDLQADLSLLPQVETQNQQTNYLGAGGGGTVPVVNLDQDDVLPLPVINWNEKV